MADCTLADPLDAEWGSPLKVPLTACGEPAIALVTFICVHEHVDRALACAGCAADLQKAAGVLICAHCEDGSQAHNCPVTMKIWWFADARTDEKEIP